MIKVTDPALLSQLEGTPTGNKVTDPELLAQLEGQAPKKDFAARMQEDFERRKLQSRAMSERALNMEQSTPENLAQMAGIGLGLMGDVAGNVIGSAYRALPEVGTTEAVMSGLRGIGQGIQSVAPNAKTGLDYLMSEGARLAEENPRAAANLGAIANIASVAPIGAGVKGAAKIAANPELQQAALRGAGNTLKLSKDVALAPAKLAAKAALPNIDEGLRETAKLAYKYKIPVSLDQVSRSRALKSAQKVSQEAPFSGQEAFRAKQIGAWNKAVTKTLGKESDVITPEYIDDRFTELGAKFNNLGKGQTLNPQNLLGKVDELTQEAIDMGASRDAVEGFRGFVERELQGNLTPEGMIKGESLNRIRTKANKLARTSNNFDSKSLYHNFESEVIDNLLPDSAAKESFAELKKQYKNLLTVEPLLKDEVGGVVSPAKLANRMATIYQRQYYRGKAGELGELARVGKQLLPELGGSDTTQKMAGLAAVTGMATVPATIPLVTGGIVANRLGQTLINRNQALINWLVSGKKPSVKEIGKMKPAEAKETINLLRQTEGMTDEQLKEFIKQNIKE